MKQKQKEKEAVAVVGVACQFPGGCDSPERYWAFLRRGGFGIGEVPAERWLPEPENPESRATRRHNPRWGGFLADPFP